MDVGEGTDVVGCVIFYAVIYQHGTGGDTGASLPFS